MPHGADAGHEAVAADGGEVVHGHRPGKRGMVVDVDVSAQQRGVGDDDVIAQLAIVGDVAAGHEEVVVADAGDAVLLFGGAVDGDALADDVVVADDHLGVGAAVADVLRLAADDHVGIEVVAAAEGDVAHQGDVVFQPRAAADAHLAGRSRRRGRSRLRRRFRRGSIATLSAMRVLIASGSFIRCGRIVSAQRTSFPLFLLGFACRPGSPGPIRALSRWPLR